MRIGHKIMVSLAIMGGLVLTLAAFTVFAASHMDESLRIIAERTLKSVKILNEVFRHTHRIAIEERRALFFDEPGSMEHLRENARALTVEVDRMAQVASDEEDAEKLRQLCAQVRKSAALEEQIIGLYQSGQEDEARRSATYEAAALRWDIVKRCEELLEAYETKVISQESHYTALGLNLKKVSVTLAIVAVLLAALLWFQGTRTLSLPLRRLVEATREIRAGDLDIRVEGSSHDELGDLATSFNQMLNTLAQRMAELREAETAVAQANKQLREHNDRIMREVRLAREIQKSMVPRNFQADGVRVYTRIEAARQVGGDFYDIGLQRRGDPILRCVIGDVMGQGIPAAFLMVVAITTLRDLFRVTNSPREVLERANARIREHMRGDECCNAISAAALSINLRDRQMVYSKAGHEDLLWWSASNGEVKALSTGGVFLGILDDGFYEEDRVRLGRRDKIILYTDGITESRNPARDFFTVERLIALVEKNGSEAPDVLGRRILQTVARFRDHRELTDDIALVIIEVE